MADFANTVDPDEAAHNEPPQLDLQFAHKMLITQYDKAWMKHFMRMLSF